MDAAWRAIVNDPDKLDAVVDAMANCMGKVLSLTDNEVGDGRMTLGQALYEEKEHFPTREQLDQIDEIHKAMAFVDNAHTIARQVCQDAEVPPNVLLSPYANAPTFCQSWTFTRQQADGTGESRLRVGGLRRAVYGAVVDLVYNWLLECDESMMVTFNDMPKGERVDESPLYSLARDLADSIARRISMFEPNRTRDDAGEDLSTRVLQERANEQVARNAMEAAEHQRTDLVALRALEMLAQHGPNSDKGKTILHTRLEHLRYVVRKPPIELGLTGSNAARMNLQLLARACESDLDVEVRIGMVRQWHMRHGGYAVTAAAQAIQKIKCWASTQQQPFIKVLQPQGEPAGQHGIELPRMPFVREAHKWHFVKHAERRTALDWLGRRVVRMTSLVLQLLAHGSLERGVTASTIVSPVATQAVLEARVVYALLKVKLDSYALGTKLLRFCENVADSESHLSNDISDAMLHLSRFSTLELLSIFSPQSPALRVIMNDFTTRTRSNLTFHMPEHYVAFAYDAMAVLLPALRNRRESVGITMLQTTTPICQLLKAMPKVRAWSPLQGALRLELDDLKGQPKMLLKLLKEFASRKVLVAYKRPYIGNQRHAPKLAFVFNNAELTEALGGWPVRPCSRLGWTQ